MKPIVQVGYCGLQRYSLNVPNTPGPRGHEQIKHLLWALINCPKWILAVKFPWAQKKLFVLYLVLKILQVEHSFSQCYKFNSRLTLHLMSNQFKIHSILKHSWGIHPVCIKYPTDLLHTSSHSLFLFKVVGLNPCLTFKGISPFGN